MRMSSTPPPPPTLGLLCYPTRALNNKFQLFSGEASPSAPNIFLINIVSNFEPLCVSKQRKSGGDMPG